MLDRGAIDRLRNLVQFRIGTIKQNHAPLRKKTGKQAGKSAAEILAGTVGITQETGDFGITKDCSGGLNNSINFSAKLYRAYWSVRHTLRGQRQLLERTIRTGNDDLIDFREIMVRGRQPEYRNGLGTRAGSLIRELNSRYRLETGKQRPTEKRYLLAGHDGRSAGT